MNHSATKLTTQLEHLERLKSTLWTQLSRCDEAALYARPGENQWHLLDVAEHLYRVEEYAMTQYDENRERRHFKNTTDHIRFAAVKFVLATALKVKTPIGEVDPVSNLSPDALDEQWTALRKRMQTIIATLDENALRCCYFYHPYAGNFTWQDGLDFLIRHWQHHERQIQRLVEHSRHAGPQP